MLSEDIAVTNKNAYDVQDGPKPKLRPRPHATISLDPVVVSFGSTLSITVNLELETGLRINEEAPNSWRSYFLSTYIFIIVYDGCYLTSVVFSSNSKLIDTTTILL